MESQKETKACVHCLRETNEWDWDHVLPVSWYGELMTPEEEKWKVPSCIPCNKAYGRIEQDMLIMLSFCFDPNDPLTKRIRDKALRAIDPECAKSEKDRKARAAKKTQILSQMREFTEAPADGVFPNFGAQDDNFEEGHIAVLIPVRYFRRMAEKFVRGMAYINHGALIGHMSQIQMFVLEDESAGGFVELIKRYGEEFTRGKTVRIWQAVIPDDPEAGIYSIEIWERFKLYMVVEPSEKSAFLNLDPWLANRGFEDWRGW